MWYFVQSMYFILYLNSWSFSGFSFKWEKIFCSVLFTQTLMLLIWSEKCAKPKRLNCQVQVTVVQLANTGWFFHLPLQAVEIEVKDPNFFIETFLSPFKHCILTFAFKAWMKNCNHDPYLFGGEQKILVELRLYNLCKYTIQKEMLANNNWGEIWSRVLIRALQTLKIGPKDLEEIWLLQTGKKFF